MHKTGKVSFALYFIPYIEHNKELAQPHHPKASTKFSDGHLVPKIRRGGQWIFDPDPGILIIRKLIHS